MYRILMSDKNHEDALFYTLSDYDRAEGCAKVLRNSLSNSGKKFCVKILNENDVTLWRKSNLD